MLSFLDVVRKIVVVSYWLPISTSHDGYNLFDMFAGNLEPSAYLYPEYAAIKLQEFNEQLQMLLWWCSCFMHRCVRVGGLVALNAPVRDLTTVILNL
jgi:hypothetical protein